MKSILLIIGFVVMVAAQWYIPGRLIYAKERVLSLGKEFRFRTEPYDPYDAFRGKYIYLNFRQTSLQMQDSVEWQQGDLIYGLLSTDSSGFAIVTKLTKEEPEASADYLKVTAGYVYEDSVTSVSFNYPFDRFYMEESKASKADEAYREAIRDTSQVAYALISIYHGEGTIEDVLINGKPIRQVAIERQKLEDQVQ